MAGASCREPPVAADVFGGSMEYAPTVKAISPCLYSSADLGDPLHGCVTKHGQPVPAQVGLDDFSSQTLRIVCRDGSTAVAGAGCRIRPRLQIIDLVEQDVRIPQHVDQFSLSRPIQPAWLQKERCVLKVRHILAAPAIAVAAVADGTRDGLALAHGRTLLTSVTIAATWARMYDAFGKTCSAAARGCRRRSNRTDGYC
jgi:hypothetical protein